MFSDIHTHIMPGVDDGSPSMDDSIQWLQQMQTAGFEHIALTPHIHWTCDPTVVRQYAENTAEAERFEEYMRTGQWGIGGIHPATFVPAGFSAAAEAAANLGITVTLHQGGELHPSVADQQDADSLAIIALGPAKRQWILMEIDLFSPFDERWSTAAAHLRHCGFEIVMAHPERSPNMHTPAAQARLRDEVNNGAVLQVNAGSLLKTDSPQQQLALAFIADGLVTVIASDTHPVRNPVTLADIYLHRISLGLSDADVTQLTYENPTNLLLVGHPNSH